MILGFGFYWFDISSYAKTNCFAGNQTNVPKPKLIKFKMLIIIFEKLLDYSFILSLILNRSKLFSSIEFTLNKILFLLFKLIKCKIINENILKILIYFMKYAFEF